MRQLKVHHGGGALLMEHELLRVMEQASRVIEHAKVRVMEQASRVIEHAKVRLMEQASV